MILFRHSFNGHTRGAAGRELQSGSTEGVGGRRGEERRRKTGGELQQNSQEHRSAGPSDGTDLMGFSLL